jgi:pimeloyl-ACP methyl ester carboxylesterase
MELAYSKWGNTSSDQKILLLHGMGGTGAIWRPIATSLEEDFEILAPDQRGHGGSRATPMNSGFHPDDFGQDLVETLDTLAFHPTWVVGHSMGARSACALTRLKSEWIRGVILVDLGFVGLAGGGFGENLSNLLKDLPMEFESRDAARDYLKKHSPDSSISQYLMAVSIPVQAGDLSSGVTFPFDRESLLATIHSARNLSLREWVAELARNETPILALRGAESRVWSKADFEHEKRLFAKYPSLTFEEMPGAGHGLPFEKRAEFTSRLRRFIAESF